MEAVTLAEAIDDYLHVIVRTRPWTKRREEEVLVRLVDSLRQGHAAEPRLVALTDEAVVAQACVELREEELTMLILAVRNFLEWASEEGLIASATSRVCAAQRGDA